MSSNPPQDKPLNRKQMKNLSDAELLAALQTAMRTQADALQQRGWQAEHEFGYSVASLMDEADRRGVWQAPAPGGNG